MPSNNPSDKLLYSQEPNRVSTTFSLLGLKKFPHFVVTSRWFPFCTP